MNDKVHIIGGGLAGCEAALVLARAGFRVTLYESRPEGCAPDGVFRTGGLCELVCSNSLGSVRPGSAPGILKNELLFLGSEVLAAALESRVPGGQALCVDRAAFSESVRRRIASSGDISVERREISSIDEFPPGETRLVATGPLTGEKLFASLSRLFSSRLYFYDAVAPIVAADSIDMRRAFWENRYGRGTPDYLNIALNRDEYDRFYSALVAAETVPPSDEEKEIFFEGCMPVEELARRGPHTLRFGPMKPKGFTDARTGRMPYALLQLRSENSLHSAFNLVGFQTKMKFGEQKRVLSTIPGLENVRILRYGVIHKNRYIHSPEILEFDMSVKNAPEIFVAGQISGSEGYTEAIATGMAAALSIVYRSRSGKRVSPFDAVDYRATMLGSLLHYICRSGLKFSKFAPMNANFALVDPSRFSREDFADVSKAEIAKLKTLFDTVTGRKMFPEGL